MSQWSCKLDGKDVGPLSFAELADMVRDGKVTEGVQVCRAGTMNWEPAWHVPGLFRAAGIVEPGDSAPPEEDAALSEDRAGALLPPGYAPAAVMPPRLTLASIGGRKIFLE